MVILLPKQRMHCQLLRLWGIFRIALCWEHGGVRGAAYEDCSRKQTSGREYQHQRAVPENKPKGGNTSNSCRSCYLGQMEHDTHVMVPVTLGNDNIFKQLFETG